MSAVGGFYTGNTDNRGCRLVNNVAAATIVFVAVVDVGVGVLYCDNIHNSTAFTSHRPSAVSVRPAEAARAAAACASAVTV